MIERLLALQERARPIINRGRAAASEIMGDDLLRREIDALYSHYFGGVVSGCKNCYLDALIELSLLKKSNAMSKSSLFVMRRGVILRDTRTGDAGLNLVRGNETDELALYHLSTNPAARGYFEELPSESVLAEMLAAYENDHGVEAVAWRSEPDAQAALDVLAEARAKAAAIVEAAKVEAQAVIDNAHALAREARSRRKGGKVDPSTEAAAKAVE